ncbi:multicopper oxidase family protein [Paractinoplanes ferrugineus]|uniref:FtsP/CotA-like multicopper oxidase with cupredoxin domain n=1 Tax=Paractinoplanes ferrugineus TaxID=113564 RepID=A0A919J4W4_9ACTN|nr:multicopper oxidase family protein [Actinoplanes ferrugineus]GIE13694.1 hypothetical protein Afe05nite_55340 [Actinoplanes ferrugineus]
MFATYQQLDFILQLVLFPVWLVAATAAGRLARRPDQRRLRRTARLLTGWLVLALVLVLGRVFAAAMMGRSGWIFIADRIALSLLAMVPAALAVVVLTLPRLVRLARSAGGGRGTPVTREQLRLAVSPGLTVPVRLAAFASLLGFFEKFLPVDNKPVFVVTMPLLALVVVGAALLASARQRVHLVLAGRRAPAGRRWAKRLGAVAVVLALVGFYITTGLRDKMPATFSMMEGESDFGGGAAVHDHGGQGGAGGAGSVSVTDLTGPALGAPDKRFELVADEKKIKLASGAEVDAWAFNGQIPGPELRMTQGDVVEITVVNKLDHDPVAVHWHGLDVPNAMDGVAGVTQDAVAPGGKFVYKFRVDEVGTRWYHSHQAASEQVARGLFGPMVIEPRTPVTAAQDVSVVLQDWATDRGKVTAFGTADQLDRRALPAGTQVRLRLVNAANTTHDLAVLGAPFRIVALDGTDLHGPTELRDRKLVVGSASRVDVEFTMPAGPVRLADLGDPGSGLLFSPDGQGDLKIPDGLDAVDVYSYGTPTSTPFGPDSHFDRTYKMVFDGGLGFYNGGFALRQAINGAVFPDVPMQMVTEGDLVRLKFINRGEEDHPMHIHGHHFLVLSHNGKDVSGSPLWLDTVVVRPGDIVEVGLRADNPGVWMDHCHNFDHTKLGMVMHLAYAGVNSPFVVGGQAGNHPD